MSKLEYLFLHCSATTFAHNTKPKDIISWHRQRFKSGNRIGYTHFIDNDAKVHRLVEVNHNDIIEPNEVTYGAVGFNHNSRHICCSGGLSTEVYLDLKTGLKLNKIQDTRTEAQKKVMAEVCHWYVEKYPNIKIIGHNQVARKGCPSYFVPDWLLSVGIPEKNIDFRDPYKMKIFLSKNSQFVKI